MFTSENTYPTGTTFARYYNVFVSFTLGDRNILQFMTEKLILRERERELVYFLSLFLYVFEGCFSYLKDFFYICHINPSYMLPNILLQVDITTAAMLLKNVRDF